MAHQQTGANRHTADPRNQGRLEPVAGKQFPKPCGVVFKHPFGTREKGGKTQSCHCLDVLFPHGFDYRLRHSLVIPSGLTEASPDPAKTKPPGFHPAVRNLVLIDQYGQALSAV
ncbi:hypothetical protein [Mesorhizobium sp. B2-3-5]|uniref:hypothetical protein n=1 Tax=Mesorhizobium sp. B2-3-5 TaxID=2589958 RepID=UPI001FEF4989|nr:hypothetical protein [Mesorhizobium sp. B2-3-5]